MQLQRHLLELQLQQGLLQKLGSMVATQLMEAKLDFSQQPVNMASKTVSMVMALCHQLALIKHLELSFIKPQHLQSI